MARNSTPPAYPFNPPLSEGIVMSRPNRFVMMVQSKGRTLRCHCPTTGRLGDLDLHGIPCLFSNARNTARKTAFTVEAVSAGKTRERPKSWIGINQTAANRYIEHLLRTGQLSRMVKGEVKREVRLGSSRIDFQVGRTYLEVKTPLIVLPSAPGVRSVSRSRFNSYDRLIKHMTELSKSLKDGKRAVIVMCYLYDAKRFKPPSGDSDNSRILDVARKAEETGVETWQVNLNLDRNGVTLNKYFRNHLFSRSRTRDHSSSGPESHK
ncbi:MAG: DNA/RNA nuclease SfsA [Thaumarchaeota archaeon]|nr:DNA/RNA nuclease SfsA [Nitrososphaerota archaeon]